MSVFDVIKASKTSIRSTRVLRCACIYGFLTANCNLAFLLLVDVQEPYAIVILLQNDLVLIDVQTNGFPSFENPYPMDIHESPVTCCSYFADCPSDIIPAFYSVGRATQKRSGFSDKDWPISGGEWSPTSCSYNEIIITG